MSEQIDVDADELGIFRDMMNLADNVQRWSRTPRAGRLRLLAVQNVLFGEPDVDTIARRMKVSPRRVYQALNEVRGHCKPFVRYLRASAALNELSQWPTE